MKALRGEEVVPCAGGNVRYSRIDVAVRSSLGFMVWRIDCLFLWSTCEGYLLILAKKMLVPYDICI